MAPLKRPYDAVLSDGFDIESSVEIFVDPVLGTSPPFNNKKFKVTSPQSAKKNQIRTFLDFDDINVDVDVALTNGPSDELVSGDAWLNSVPGSPIHEFGFHELPSDDSSSDSDSGPASYALEAANLTDAYDELPFDSDLPDLLDIEANIEFKEEKEMVVQTKAQVKSSAKASAKTSAKSTSKSPAKFTVKAEPQSQHPAATMTSSYPQTAGHVAITVCTGPCCVRQTAVGAATAAIAKSPSTPKFNGYAGSESAQAEQNGDKSSTRWAHNSTERKRRCEIRRLFSGLRDMFPDLQGDDRTSNINTLNRAIQCVAEMSRKAVEQETALRLLRERNTYLKQQIAARNGGVVPVTKASQRAKQPRSATTQPATTYPSPTCTQSYPQTHNQSYSQSHYSQGQRNESASSGYPQQYPQTVVNTTGHAASTSASQPSSGPRRTVSHTRYVVADTYPQYVVEIVTEVPVDESGYPETGSTSTVQYVDAQEAAKVQAQAQAQAEAQAQQQVKIQAEAKAKAEAVAAAARARVEAEAIASKAKADAEAAKAKADAEADAEAKIEAEKQARLTEEEVHAEVHASIPSEVKLEVEEPDISPVIKPVIVEQSCQPLIIPKVRSKSIRKSTNKMMVDNTVPEDTQPVVLYNENSESVEPVAKIHNGALTLVTPGPSARKALPNALRQLLDHNGRGGREQQPLQKRRSRAVVRLQ